MAFSLTNNNDMQQSRDSNSIDIIEKTTKVVGDITSKADFRIDGNVEGTITTTGKVVVGENGVVSGKITCSNSDIAGLIKGSLDVSGILSLKSSARVEGDVVAGKLAVESGANVDANISMKGAKKMKALTSDEKQTPTEKTA
ncbi:MAG: polymer-forming cytoskeletal protein [Flavobacteriaceae bacterium]|jgi:cytoskeletal protein CcmA (bactofilin family)|nr:polymer-forming cytoskeletal protein [Flavobacteriaceae bacterium]MDG1974860.1 polymer-forming cytoskeletal protein [Flavobacteriaceae bacterium]|tara:strand:+ start:203 stop:628 length:426 start_codon:yes stop_codon:yes gene_type:complete